MPQATRISLHMSEPEFQVAGIDLELQMQLGLLTKGISAMHQLLTSREGSNRQLTWWCEYSVFPPRYSPVTTNVLTGVFLK